jgi:1-acyl-sn-glycerol-3-phosphate acyltransferase
MSDDAIEQAGNSETSDIEMYDAEFTKKVTGVLRPILRRYFRTEVRGLEHVPATGGALLVSNHSGGQYAFDVPIIAVEFYEKWGYQRPIHTLSHDMLFVGPLKEWMVRLGFIHANTKNAADALRADHLVVVFPGGDYDAMRPTLQQNKIDFAGRKGYVRTAIAAGVPIVPVVSIGGQENQLYLTRGTSIAKALGPIARATRTKIAPLAVGFPFGLSIFGTFPPNLPLPTKIVTEVLEPIDVLTEFGPDPGVEMVDKHVRAVMQNALDRLGRERRFPIVG